MTKYILTIDQGTTSTKAIIFDALLNKIINVKKEIKIITTKEGFVLQDPEEIYQSVIEVINEAIEKSNISPLEIDSIGITNQRETLIMWDKTNYSSVYKAIVWQSRQSKDICDSLISNHKEALIQEKTGLLINPYFSASKIKWIIDNVPYVKEKIADNRILCGTVDTYILYRLTNGKSFKTDYTNASRTMLFNINTLNWDQELLDLFDVKRNMLPEVCDCSSLFGVVNIKGVNIRITSMIGDQQASLFGHTCFNQGDLKVTYGTGCFMLMNTKEKKCLSKKGLLTTIAYKYKDEISYALEGSVFIAGSALNWLKDNLNLFSNPKETEILARSVKDSNGIYFVPSFVGLGTPYWDNECRGSIFGLTQGCTKAHLVRATLEAICYQANDVFQVFQQESNNDLNNIYVDGGVANNNFMLEFQADITNANINKPMELETTSLGALFLAGLYTGFFRDLKSIKELNKINCLFKPTLDEKTRKNLLDGWDLAVSTTRKFRR